MDVPYLPAVLIRGLQNGTKESSFVDGGGIASKVT